jgi:hypothetical protein
LDHGDNPFDVDISKNLQNLALGFQHKSISQRLAGGEATSLRPHPQLRISFSQ